MKANNFCWILVGLICLTQISHSRRLHFTESSGIKEKRQSGGYSSPGGYANVASGGYSAAKSNESENDVDATTTLVYDETNNEEEGTSEDYQSMTTQNPTEDEAEGGYGGGSSSSGKASGGYGSPVSSPVSGGYGSSASAASGSKSMGSGGYDYTPSKMSDAEEDSNAEASTDKMMTEGEEMMTGRPLDQEQLENFNYPQQTSLEVPMARGGYSSPVANSGANYNTFNNYGPPPSNNYGPPARDTSNAVGGYGPAVSNNYGPPAQPMSNTVPLQQQGNNAAVSAPATPPNDTSSAPQNYYSNTNEIVPQPTSYLPAPMMNAYRYQTMQYQPHFNGPEDVKPQVIPSIGYYLPPVQQQQQQQGRALEATEPQQRNIQQQQTYGPPQPQNTYDARNSAPAVYSPPGTAESQNQVGQQNLALQPRQEEQGQHQNAYAPPAPQPEQARQEEASVSNEYGPPEPLSQAPRAPVGFQLDFEEFHDNDNVVDAELIQRVQEIIAEHERQQKELREKLRREYAATEAAFFGNGHQQQYGPPQQGFTQQGQFGAPAQPATYRAPQHHQQQAQFAPAQQQGVQHQQYGPPKDQQKTEYGVPEQRFQPEAQYAKPEEQEYPQQQQPSQYGPPQQEQPQYGPPKEQQRQQQYGAPKEQRNQYRQPEPDNQYGSPAQQESGDRKPVQKYQQPAAEYGQPEAKSAGQEEYSAPAPQQYNSPADQQDTQNSVYGPPAAQGREIDFDRQNSNQADQETNSRKAPKRYQNFELQKAILKDHFVDTLPGNQYSSSGPQFGNQPSSNYPSPANVGAQTQAYGVPGKQFEQNLHANGVHHQQQQHHLQGEQEQLRSVPQFNQQTPLAVYGSVGFSNQGNVISMPDFSLLTGYNVHPTPTAFTHLAHEQLQQQPQSHYPQPQNSYHQQQSHGQSFPTSNTQAIILQQIPTAYSTASPTANNGNPSDFSSVQYGVAASATAPGSGPSAGHDVQSAGHPQQQSTQSSPSSASYSAAEQDQQDQQQHSFSSPQSFNQQLDQFVNPTYAPAQPREEEHEQQQIGYVFPQTSSFIPQSAYGVPESLATLNEIPTSSPKPVYGIPLAPALGLESFAPSSPSAPSPTAPTSPAFDQRARFAPQPQHQMFEPVTFTQAQFAYQQQQPSPSYGVSPFNHQQNQHHHHQQLALSSPSAPSYPQASSELEQQQQQPLWSSQAASPESNQGQHNSDQDGHLNSITVPSQAYGLRTVPDVLNVNNNNVAAHNNQLYESSSPSGHQAQGGYSSRFPRRSRKVVRKNVRRSTTTTTEKTA